MNIRTPFEVDTIEVFDEVWRGMRCGNVGVYTDPEDGNTYAGEREGAYAHGYGVYKSSDGYTASGQFANGSWNGYREAHGFYGDGVVDYSLYEGGINPVHRAIVRPNGACEYDDQPCGADHTDHVALKAAAQQAGVRATI